MSDAPDTSDTPDTPDTFNKKHMVMDPNTCWRNHAWWGGAHIHGGLANFGEVPGWGATGMRMFPTMYFGQRHQVYQIESV